MANYQFKPADRMATNKMHPVDPYRQVNPRRPLGETGLMVGAVGLGGMPLGRQGLAAIPDFEAREFIAAALDQEANLIDLAPSYGAGRAEELVGSVIATRRHQAVIVTKAGYFPGAEAEMDFSPAAIRASLEGSLKRLKTGFVDVLLLHNPGLELLNQASPAFAELEKLKKEGKIRAYGAAVNGSAQIKQALEKTASQVLEFPFSIFNQEAAPAFEAAKAKRVGLLACSPLDSGFLSGRYGKHAVFLDERRRFNQFLSRTEIQRRDTLLEAIEFLADGRTHLAQAALQFVLAHEAVSCVVPGASDWHQVVDNIAAASEAMAPATVARLKAFWESRLKAEPLAL